jgi:hypothetical protein
MIGVSPVHHFQQPGTESDIAVHHLDFFTQRELRQKLVRPGINLLAGESRSRRKAAGCCVVICIGHE